MEKNSRIHFEEINILSVVARAHSQEICTKVFFSQKKKMMPDWCKVEFSLDPYKNDKNTFLSAL